MPSFSAREYNVPAHHRGIGETSDAIAGDKAHEVLFYMFFLSVIEEIS